MTRLFESGLFWALLLVLGISTPAFALPSPPPLKGSQSLGKVTLSMENLDGVQGEIPGSSASPNPEFTPPLEAQSLFGRRLLSYEKVVAMIKAEKFSEALTFVRRLPKDIRDWIGLRSLEAALVSSQKPQEALVIYDGILNGKVRDIHWVRALIGYRFLVKELSEAGDYAARFRLIKCLAFEWRNREARALLQDTLKDEALPQALRADLLSFDGVLAIRLGDFESAYAYFQGKKDRSSLRWLSTISIRRGNHAESALFREEAAKSLKGKYRIREYGRTFDILIKGGLTTEAENLLARVPELKAKVPAWSFYLGLSALVAGEPEKALPYFEPELTSGGLRAQRALYFQGRAYEMLTQQPEAALAYEKALGGPFNYYKLLSLGRYNYLNSDVTKELPLAGKFLELLESPTGKDQDSLGFYLWLRSKVPWPWPDLEVSYKPQGGPGDLARIRYAIFYYWGRGDVARASLELKNAQSKILNTREKVVAELTRYLFLASSNGDYDVALKIMLSLPSVPGKPTGEEETNPWEVFRSSYPLVWGEELRGAFRRYGLPPQLVLAVIYTESLFQKEAVSFSNARGLMQLLPTTATQVAALMGEKNSPREEDLFVPAINIRYGTHYLHLLRESFRDIPIALAAYNCGPFNVLSLLKAKPGLAIDLFVETLPFSETGDYVRHVLEHIYLYEVAYLGQGNLPDLTRPVSYPAISPPDF
ncbi:MAG: transglycosylase SLT domain-containing protein [Deltaproteobacteria bacterium]|jgi:soluble lytic murein transglycosylase|nr:transglycosylase SLT domain-containing protein [Deltaproteobacteria bacterium]